MYKKPSCNFVRKHKSDSLNTTDSLLKRKIYEKKKKKRNPFLAQWMYKRICTSDKISVQKKALKSSGVSWK